MKNTGRIIILAAVLMIAAGCNPKGIIPKGKMAKIYADMYLMDQYAQATPEYRTIADTCALYKFILADYGYTSEQFTESIDHYLTRSKDMKDILDGSEAILKAREESILKEIDRQAKKQTGREGRKRKNSDTLDTNITDNPGDIPN